MPPYFITLIFVALFNIAKYQGYAVWVTSLSPCWAFKATAAK